jgi:hypothetical protein
MVHQIVEIVSLVMNNGKSYGANGRGLTTLGRNCLYRLPSVNHIVSHLETLALVIKYRSYSTFKLVIQLS